MGDRKIHGYRARDGDEEGLCGSAGETVSASQGTDQARAPHGVNSSTNNDVKMKKMDHELRMRNTAKSRELLLGKEEKGNTGMGGASRTWLPVPIIHVVMLIDDSTPHRSDLYCSVSSFLYYFARWR